MQFSEVRIFVQLVAIHLAAGTLQISKLEPFSNYYRSRVNAFMLTFQAKRYHVNICCLKL